MYRSILAIAALISIAACNNDDKEAAKESPTKQLSGEWNNLSIKIDINTVNNTDSNTLFSVERPEWESKLKIKPIRTYFRTDSTWNSAHYDLNDSMIYNPAGKWRVEGNKIIMEQDFPSSDTTIYQFKLNKDTVEFEAMVDWDEDGKKDDKYFGKQIKVSRKQ